MTYPIKITLLGCCRQESLYNDPKYQITCIRNYISYSHYSKEALEIIKYCKYGHISPMDTMEVFRTPILEKRPIYWNPYYKNELDTSDVFIIEIASKTAYEFNNVYRHNIVVKPEHNEKVSCKDNIIIRKQSYEEIENDILEIKRELGNKKIMIVSHIYSYEYGERYELVKCLETICQKYSITFLNPIREITLSFPEIDINTLFVNEDTLKHYNEFGHTIIKKVYDDFIQKILLAT